MTNQTIAEQSVDTRLLVALLQKAEIGQVFNYTELSERLGRSIMGAEPSLSSARRIVQRDFDIVFDVIRGQGIKRLSDAEIVALGDTLPGRVRRTARRMVQKIAKAKDGELSKDQITQRNAVVSMAGALIHMASKSNMAKLEDAVRVNAGELAVGKTLELFKG